MRRCWPCAGPWCTACACSGGRCGVGRSFQAGGGRGGFCSHEVAAGDVVDCDEEVEQWAQAVGRALALHKALGAGGGEHRHCLGIALAAAKAEGILSPTEYDAGRRVSRAANRARHEPFTTEEQLNEGIAARKL